MTTFELWYRTVPEDRNDTTAYDLRRAYYTLPYELLESWRTASPTQLRYTTWNHLPSIDGSGRFLKKKNHPSVKLELEWYNSDAGKLFREHYKLVDDPNDEYYRYEKYKEGGLLKYYKPGGSIHINPENKGKFTETKKRTGKTTEELTHSKNPLTRKRAIFAQNAKKWKHEEGGVLQYFIPAHKGGNTIDLSSMYIVQDGDTFGGIANKLGKSQAELRHYNLGLIKDFDKLGVGLIIYTNQRLIPYKVRKGDTLSSISKASGMSVAQIRELNKNIKNDNIFEDQEITLLTPAWTGGGQLTLTFNAEGVEGKPLVVTAKAVPLNTSWVQNTSLQNPTTLLPVTLVNPTVTGSVNKRSLDNVKNLLINVENKNSFGLSTYNGRQVWYHPTEKLGDTHQFAWGLDDRNEAVKKKIRYDNNGRAYLLKEDADILFRDLVKEFDARALDRLDYAKSYALKHNIPFVYNPEIHDLITNLAYQWGSSAIAKHKELFENDNFLRTVSSGNFDKVLDLVVQFYRNHGHNPRAENIWKYYHPEE